MYNTITKVLMNVHLNSTKGIKCEIILNSNLHKVQFQNRQLEHTLVTHYLFILWLFSAIPTPLLLNETLTFISNFLLLSLPPPF